MVHDPKNRNPIDGLSFRLAFDLPEYAERMMDWQSWLHDKSYRDELGYGDGSGFQMAIDSGRQWRTTQELLYEEIGHTDGSLVQLCVEDLWRKSPVLGEIHYRYWDVACRPAVWTWKRSGARFPPAMFDVGFTDSLQMAIEFMVPLLRGKALLT